MTDVRVRPAESGDAAPVIAFTEDTWTDHEDYLPRVVESWIESDAEDRETFVATVGGDPVGVLQAVALTEWEGWLQGLRVHPEHRGAGVATALCERGFDWCASRGAAVARAMVFSWNEMGLGLSRHAGFDPAMEFRLVRPRPTDGPPATASTADADAAWSLWSGSAHRDALRGLVLDPRETWACSELTRERLHRAAADDRLVVVGDDRVAGFAWRVRTTERDDGSLAEYAVAAWRDGGCAPLFDAIGRDAGAAGADRTRVLVPETVAAVSDVAAARVDVDTEPNFVLAAPLSP